MVPPPPPVAFQEMEALLVDTCSPATTTTHDTREVSEDPLLEEVVASFATTSACTCATSTMVSHPAELVLELVPPPLEHGQSQVTPPQATQTTTSGADAPTQDELGGPPGFGPAEPTADADTIDVSDSSTTRRLKSFTR